MVPLVEILLTVVCVKMVRGRHLFSFLTSIDGTSTLTAPSVFLYILRDIKESSNQYRPASADILWLPLFIRIKVKWVPVTAVLGEGCWLSPLWCCTLGIYNGRRVSVAPWKMSREADKHLPELYNTFAVLSSSDLIPVFLPSSGANLIFAGLCGRTFICHLRSFCQNHGASAGNPASISEI